MSDDNEQQRTFTQEDVDRIVAERLERDRKARDLSPAEVQALKVAATKAQREAEDTRSEAEKQAERLAALEQANAELKLDNLRTKVQAKYSLSDDDVQLFLTATDPEQLDRQGKALHDRQPAVSGGVTRDGDNPQPQGDEVDSFLDGLLNR